MPSTPALSTDAVGSPLAATMIERRELRPHDVAIDISFCGICHSDIHQVKNEWGNATFPMVPGHEIAGVVTAVGSDVSRFSVGDRVGVGCMVDSCGECEYCLEGEEQFCTKPSVQTYNGRDYDGEPTFGGYSRQDRRQRPVRREHPRRPRAGRGRPAAVRRHHHLLAALRHWKVGPGTKVAIVGMGGLGHVAREDRRGDGRRGDGPEPDARQAGGRICASAPRHYHATSERSTFKELAARLRPDPQHGLGEPRPRTHICRCCASTASWSRSASRRSPT